MKDYPTNLKELLTSIVKEMAESPELFVKRPDIDFTRNRKLPFETMINILLSMGGNTIYKELLEAQGYNSNVATTSAFVQQRDKILDSALEFIFHEFTMSLSALKTYLGYRLLATDGSDLRFATDPNDPDTYFQPNPDKNGYNLLHLNALYDLCNRIYVDALIQPRMFANEHSALTDMVNRSRILDKVILIADRGYECYNNFAHIESKGWNYVIRVKDVDSNGIIASLVLPKSGSFDVPVTRILTRSKANNIKAHPEMYTMLRYSSRFDFLDKENLFYTMSFRVVRFMVDDGIYETVITNLPQSEFPPSKIKILYNMRWGIEISFRHLKHTIGLVNFHARKQEYITQEIFARLVTYNFAEMITSNVVISEPNSDRYAHQVNFTVAALVCKRFLRLMSDVLSHEVEALIRRNTVPIRPGRTFPRNIRTQSNVSFIYRVA